MTRSTRSSRRNPEPIAFARGQRATANECSQVVWQIVRNRGCRRQKFRREYPIPPYTADFCCVALKLIVEVDGAPHDTSEGRRHDHVRDQFLAKQGYQVLRIPGFDVLRDAAEVRLRIETAIDQRLLSLNPLTSSPSSLCFPASSASVLALSSSTSVVALHPLLP